MKAVSHNGIDLTLEKSPFRKSLAFCFQQGNTLYVLGFVSKKNESLAKELWDKFTKE